MVARAIVFLTIGSLVLLARSLYLRGRTPKLLDLATPLFSIHQTGEDLPCTCIWRTSTKTLYMAYVEQRCRVGWLDADADVDHPLGHISSQLSGTNIYDHLVSPSPDGHWIASFDDSAYRFQIISTLDDHRICIPITDVVTSSLWSADGKTLGIYCSTKNRLLMCSPVEKKKSVVTLPPGFAESIIRISPDGRVLGLEFDAEAARRHIDLREFDPGKNRVLRTKRIPLPRPAVIDAVEVSPKGDRLALLVTLGDDEANWSEPLVNAGLSTTFPRIQVWTVNIQDASTHVLGEYVAARMPGLIRPRSLQWTPNGRDVLFAFNGTMYSVRAQ